jgi:hypothetical protein
VDASLLRTTRLQESHSTAESNLDTRVVAPFYYQLLSPAQTPRKRAPSGKEGSTLSRTVTEMLYQVRTAASLAFHGVEHRGPRQSIWLSSRRAAQPAPLRTRTSSCLLGIPRQERWKRVSAHGDRCISAFHGSFEAESGVTSTREEAARDSGNKNPQQAGGIPLSGRPFIIALW